MLTMNEKDEEIQTRHPKKMVSLHRLPEAEFCDEEGSLPLTIHRPDLRPFDKIELLMLLGWIIGLQPDRNLFK